jgi:hypothetical protein
MEENEAGEMVPKRKVQAGPWKMVNQPQPTATEATEPQGNLSHTSERLTNSMEQSSLRNQWSLSYQEILHLLWNLKVHYCVHKSLPLAPVLSQMHLVHIFSSYFPEIHSNIIFPSLCRSSLYSLPSSVEFHQYE